MNSVFYVKMPVTAEGDGPADEKDADRILHQIWDYNFVLIRECNSEIEAITIAKEINEGIN
ncbi:hypothetical protein [Agrobacterium sp. M50-1]|uniref:hypothetical protein n=1 Tax=Agrobacterium sp. M50-1 TaxID=3132821 RepID=UPI003CE448E7